MNAARSITNLVFWLALCLWVAAPVTAGIAAMNTFTTLPDMPLVLEEYADFPVSEHGTIAAGMVMERNFFVVDLVQFVCVPLTVIALGLQLVVFGMPLRRPVHLLRAVLIVVAAAIFGFYAFRIAPRMNHELRAYWDDARAGNVQEALAHQQAFQIDHPRADAILKLNLLLLLGAVGTSAIAFTSQPAPASSTELEPPQLASTA